MDDESSQDERSIDYLICRECSTPCYIFEMEGERVAEALCQACGNEDPALFFLGDVDEES